jgi:hypothetical protein
MGEESCGTCMYALRSSGARLCVWCEQDLLAYGATLARNLAAAGGLCAAFRLGTQWPYYLDADDMDDDYSWSTYGVHAWRPGCGRAVR